MLTREQAEKYYGRYYVVNAINTVATHFQRHDITDINDGILYVENLGEVMSDVQSKMDLYDDEAFHQQYDELVEFLTVEGLKRNGYLIAYVDGYLFQKYKDAGTVNMYMLNPDKSTVWKYKEIDCFTNYDIGDNQKYFEERCKAWIEYRNEAYN
jgi:hypothetical protein